MAKQTVNKAERNAERYDAKETGYQLYEDSLKGNKFDRLMPLIVSEQNIILAYRNICKNNGSKTPGTDGNVLFEPILFVILRTINKTKHGNKRIHHRSRTARPFRKSNGTPGTNCHT